MSSLLVFIRVYRLEIQSVMLVFLTGIVNNCPLTFSLVSSPPPLLLPCVEKYIVYTCEGGGSMGSEGGGLRRIKHLPQSPFTGQFFR